MMAAIIANAPTCMTSESNGQPIDSLAPLGVVLPGMPFLRWRVGLVVVDAPVAAGAFPCTAILHQKHLTSRPFWHRHVSMSQSALGKHYRQGMSLEALFRKFPNNETAE